MSVGGIIYLVQFQRFTDKQNFLRKIVIIFFPIIFNICFGCSKELSH